jgi:hypothetical protein
MFGPTFAPEFRAALQLSYLCSPGILQDILSAIEPAINCAKQNSYQWNKIEIAKGTTSLQALRNARVAGAQDALAVILLGQTLAAFDLLINCTSSSSTFILRYSLSCIKPWYGELATNPALDPVTITSILWDTIHCLVKREVPVIKFVPGGSQLVDRMAGLCTTLLPILYDVCMASNDLKFGVQSGSQIRQAEQKLIAWMPERPSNFSKAFTEQEVLRMEAQASMYRTAGLLICHRLINPIGTQDDIATSYANSIMLDFSKFSVLVKPASRLQNITLPIFMAALEIPDASKEIWRSIALLTVAPKCVAKIMALVDYVWIERNCGCTRFLFDLVDDGPDFVIIP